MNPILRIWKKRISYLVKLYYNFISFQIDRVTLVYLLGLIGVLGFYFKEIIVEIMEYISVGYMAMVPRMILVLSLISGNLNGYLKLADQVFLSPLNVDGKRFIKYSHALSSSIYALIWSFIWTNLYLYYRINFRATINIYFTVLVCGVILKLVILNFKFVLWNKQGKWKRRLYHTLFYSIVSSFIGLCLPILVQGYIPRSKLLIYISSSIILLIISQLLKNDVLIDWERLMNEETNKRVQNFTFLLKESSKEKKSSRRKTISIFNGRKILPFNQNGALLLLYFKMLQRGKGNLSLLVQIYFIILASTFLGGDIVTSSGVVQIKIFNIIGSVFVAYIVGDFLLSLWINLKEDIWFQIYPYTYKQKIRSIKLGPTIVLVVFLILLNIPLSIFNGWIINPIIDSIGIVILSIISVEIHSYLLMIKVKIY